MEHRHLNRLYKCAECEFTVSHELMVYVLRHFFRCTSNKYVDELEVWSPPHLKINGTMRNAGPTESIACERHLPRREEEHSRTPANTSDHRRVSEDSRLLHSSHSSTRQEEKSRTFANTHTHRRASEDSRALQTSNIHSQRGVQNVNAHSFGGENRATSTHVSKGTEVSDVTPVQVTSMTGSPMVWMVQPNANTQQQMWPKTSSSSSVSSRAEMPKPVHTHIVLQEEMPPEGSGQGKQQESQVERRQTPHNSETEAGDLCEEEDDENHEEVIELNLSCSPVPMCNPAETNDQMVTMATTTPMMNLTQTPSILQQQLHQNPSFDRMKRGRPQKPPYSNAADAEQPKNTKRMNRWAVRVLNSWADKRNREASASSSDQDLKPVPTNWAAMTVEQLDHWLSQMVSEVRRDDGQYYPYNTLYLMLTGVNRYLRNDCDRKDVNILVKDNGRFPQLRQAMETQKKLSIERGIGQQEDRRRHNAELFPHGMEARLWESKVFSLEKDLSISYAVFYYTTKLFGVSSGEEHHSLVAEQFSLGCDSVGRFVAFNRLGKKSKTTKVYALPSDPFCPVLLYEVYLGYIPPTGPLYRRLQRDPEGRMYFGPPVGKNSLATYLNNIKRLGYSQGNLRPSSTGPYLTGPYLTGPHPTGPHPTGPQPTCSTAVDFSLENSPLLDSGEAAKRHHSQSTDGSECSAEPSPKRIHTWNFDQTLSSYSPLNQS
uniref:QRICH1-like domain-containing protein n=1 Tax=Branchiostoma floridae TaxID=7739 RepID=C3XPU6_BRAFL|eukprot:XP_002613958.1 hypothetical protein BRAFLDRAFT_67479 [Branchiostoma floridae]